MIDFNTINFETRRNHRINRAGYVRFSKKGPASH